MKLLHRHILALGLLLCLPAVSRGEVLTFGFEGDVTQVHDSVGVLNFIHPGQRFVYTFSFDTNAPNVYPYPFPNAASYYGISSSLTVGGFPFTTGMPFVNIYNYTTPDDSFEVGSVIEWDRPELLPSGHGVSVKLIWGDVFQGVSLPRSPYDLALFQYTGFQMIFMAPGGSTGTSLDVAGTIDSMYLVPEPAAVFMLGLATLLVARKRRLS